MTSIDILRNELIEKILTIQDKEFLKTLDALISKSKPDANSLKISLEHRKVLEMSEQDVINGEVISQSEMNQRNREWLSGL